MCEFCGADGRSVDRLVVVSVPVQQWDYYPHNNVGGLLFSSVVFCCVVQALFFSRRERLRKTFTGRPAGDWEEDVDEVRPRRIYK